MAKTINVGGGAISVSASSTIYLPIGNTGNLSVTGETNSQRTIRSDGTFQMLQARVTANATSGSSTFRTRKNTANGNQSLSIGAAATGLFEDTSNTDSVTAGDEFNYQAVAAAGGSITFSITSILFDASTDSVAFTVNNNSVSVTADSTTSFNGLIGSGSASPTFETGIAGRCGASTLRNLFTRVSTNSRSTATTFKSRKNGADGNLSVSITAGITGFFEDTSNSDSLSDGDLYATALVTGTGGGSLLTRTRSLEYQTTNRGSLLGGTNQNNNTQNQNLTRYIGLSDGTASATTETDTQIESNLSGNISKLWIHLNTNSVTATSTFRSRLNGGNGTVAVSITASTTGAFSDTSNSDSVIPTDLVNFQLVTGSGGTLIAWRFWTALFTTDAEGQPLIKRIQTIPFLGGSLRTPNF